MSLTKINVTNGVAVIGEESKTVEDLCRVLFNTQMLLMKVNNECVELRAEIEEMKRKADPYWNS